MNLNVNYFEEENKLTRELFNLEEILAFQEEHSVEIIRGADWQYECHINATCITSQLTPLGALVVGIRQYKQINNSGQSVTNRTSAGKLSTCAVCDEKKETITMCLACLKQTVEESKAENNNNEGF